MEKVLIVDNDIDSLDTLERVLRKEFQIFRAGNGFEAIHVLDREGEMALVISELSMPVVDGVEFLMGIMHAYPETIRVVLTRSLDPDLLLAAVNDLKLFRYMVKPFNREELLLVVRQGVDLYRFNKGRKVNAPPVEVFNFPQQREYLTIEIDEAKRQEQVEALIASPLFQTLAQEKDLNPPSETPPEHFVFLEDYQTPEISFSFDLATNETAGQEEERDDTIFLIKDFVANLEQAKEDNEDDLSQLKEEPLIFSLEEPSDCKGLDLDTLIQNITTDPEDTKPQIEEMLSSPAKERKNKEVKNNLPQTTKDKKQKEEKKKTDLPDDELIHEIDTLIQKLEEEEKPKNSGKKSDNPLDSPEFRELQRQSNALIARIIRSWG